MRSMPYVISTLGTSSTLPPACWKYVNWVTSMPSSQTWGGKEGGEGVCVCVWGGDQRGQARMAGLMSV
jgi:hypothetical protein